MNDPQKLLPALAAIKVEGLPSTSSGTDPSTTHLPVHHGQAHACCARGLAGAAIAFKTSPP